MDLYHEILVQIYNQSGINSAQTESPPAVDRLVEMKCYQALVRIKEVLEHESFDDAMCFQRIEEIVCEFEALGSGAGSRHDFG